MRNNKDVLYRKMQRTQGNDVTVPSQSVWALRIWILFFMIRDDQMYGGQKPDVLDSLFVCICVCVCLCLCDAFSMCLGGGVRVGFPVREQVQASVKLEY